MSDNLEVNKQVGKEANEKLAQSNPLSQKRYFSGAWYVLKNPWHACHGLLRKFLS